MRIGERIARLQAELAAHVEIEIVISARGMTWGEWDTRRGPAHDASRTNGLKSGKLERPERSASQSRADADAFCPSRREVSDPERHPGHTHDDVHRLLDRAAHRADRVEIVETWSIEHICARFLKGLQAPECVVQIWAAAEKVLGAGGKHEIVSQAASTQSRSARRSSLCSRHLRVIGVPPPMRFPRSRPLSARSAACGA